MLCKWCKYKAFCKFLFKGHWKRMQDEVSEKCLKHLEGMLVIAKTAWKSGSQQWRYSLVVEIPEDNLKIETCFSMQPLNQNYSVTLLHPSNACWWRAGFFFLSWLLHNSKEKSVWFVRCRYLSIYLHIFSHVIMIEFGTSCKMSGSCNYSVKCFIAGKGCVPLIEAIFCIILKIVMLALGSWWWFTTFLN